MVAEKRTRARYSNAGLMGFQNPSSEGPLAGASFCSVDTMFHIFLRCSHFPEERDYGTLCSEIRRWNCQYNGAMPLCEKGEINSRNGTLRISVWYPGDVDLEDMVRILEGVPCLEAGWLRSAVDDLKRRAGLSETDKPHLDCDYNENQGRHNHKDCSYTRMEWYCGGCLSAKGGTLEFGKGMPEDLVHSVIQYLTDANAEATLMPQGQESPLIRFIWAKPLGGFWETRKTVREIVGRLPPVGQPPQPSEAPLVPTQSL